LLEGDHFLQIHTKIGALASTCRIGFAALSEVLAGTNASDVPRPIFEVTRASAIATADIGTQADVAEHLLPKHDKATGASTLSTPSANHAQWVDHTSR
jgi:hypothetical protein